jgi:hypothetical protein
MTGSVAAALREILAAGKLRDKEEGGKRFITFEELPDEALAGSRDLIKKYRGLAKRFTKEVHRLAKSKGIDDNTDPQDIANAFGNLGWENESPELESLQQEMDALWDDFIYPNDLPETGDWVDIIHENASPPGPWSEAVEKIGDEMEEYARHVEQYRKDPEYKKQFDDYYK